MQYKKSLIFFLAIMVVPMQNYAEPKSKKNCSLCGIVKETCTDFVETYVEVGTFVGEVVCFWWCNACSSKKSTKVCKSKAVLPVVTTLAVRSVAQQPPMLPARPASPVRPAIPLLNIPAQPVVPQLVQELPSMPESNRTSYGEDMDMLREMSLSQFQIVEDPGNVDEGFYFVPRNGKSDSGSLTTI